MRGLIAKIDVPVRQVLIEARIVEASDSFSKDLGTGWDTTGSILLVVMLSPGQNVGGNLAATGYFTGQIETKPDFNQTLFSENAASLAQERLVPRL